MEYDPIKDKLFYATKGNVLLREILFFVIGKLFLREAHVKRRIKQLSLPNNGQILDAGCGLGQYSLWLAKNFSKFSIIAGDVKQHFIDEGNHHSKIKGYQHLTFQYLDLLSLEEQNRYDLIVAVDIMEHIEDDVDVMKRFYDALRPNGFALIHSPGASEDSRITQFDPKYQVDEHVRPGYFPLELEEKLQMAGFQDVKLYPTYHPISGQLLWRLWQFIPLKLTSLGVLGYALIPLWFLVAYPLGYPLWWRDLHLPLTKGRGVLAIAQKQ